VFVHRTRRACLRDATKGGTRVLACERGALAIGKIDERSGRGGEGRRGACSSRAIVLYVESVARERAIRLFAGYAISQISREISARRLSPRLGNGARRDAAPRERGSPGCPSVLGVKIAPPPALEGRGRMPSGFRLVFSSACGNLLQSFL
jgi:hypothetical protein